MLWILLAVDSLSKSLLLIRWPLAVWQPTAHGSDGDVRLERAAAGRKALGDVSSRHAGGGTLHQDAAAAATACSCCVCAKRAPCLSPCSLLLIRRCSLHLCIRCCRRRWRRRAGRYIRIAAPAVYTRIPAPAVDIRLGGCAGLVRARKPEENENGGGGALWYVAPHLQNTRPDCLPAVTHYICVPRYPAGRGMV